MKYLSLSSYPPGKHQSRMTSLRGGRKPPPDVAELQHYGFRGGRLDLRYYMPKYLVLRAYQYGPGLLTSYRESNSSAR